MSPYPNETTAAKCAFVLFHETDPKLLGNSLRNIAEGLAKSGLHPDDVIEFLDHVVMHWKTLVLDEGTLQ